MNSEYVEVNIRDVSVKDVMTLNISLDSCFGQI